MRRIVLAALLAAVALPAWAANDDMLIGKDTDWPAQKICAKAGGDSVVCYMQHASEKGAIDMADFMLDDCKKNTSLPAALKQCAAVLAYIKQRWGY